MLFVAIGGLLVPEKKKRPDEMTTEEIARKLFPKRVIEEVKREVSDSDDASKSEDKG